MSDEVTVVLSKVPELVSRVETMDERLCEYLQVLGLPCEHVLVAVDDRRVVINNLPVAIKRLTPERRMEAFYVSKLVAACGAGLFDAGLTYLWDAVVASLRTRVANFDLAYFFDNAVSTNERKDFKTADDLRNLEDSKLIDGCVKCGLLSEVGYKVLDHIRDMRNWASAAHPNNAEIGGLQLMGWLETCVREVFSVEVAGPPVVAHQLLRNLREQVLDATDVPPIAGKLSQLPVETANSLLRSAVGLYADPRQERRVVDNVRLLADALWKAASVDARFEVGVKYATHAMSGDKDRKDRVREFIDLVGGLTYLPDSELAVEIQERASRLETVHFDWNNFHNEPPVARDLRAVVPSSGKIPDSVNDLYVRAVVLARVGRQSGVARGAVPIYDELINLFGDTQSKAFLNLPPVTAIKGKLAAAVVARRFGEIARVLASRTTNRTLAAALNYVAGQTPQQLANLANDSQYKKLCADVIG